MFFLAQKQNLSKYMNYLEKKIEEVTIDVLKDLEYAKGTLNLLDSIDVTPRLSQINNEHYYTPQELEKILKIHHNKKEKFAEFLAIFSGDSKRLGLNYYYSLPNLLQHLSTHNGLSSLSYYVDNRGAK